MAARVSVSVRLRGPPWMTNRTGTAIKLNVRPVHTVSNVLEFLSASTSLPVDVHLLHEGKQLDPSSTVDDLKLEPSATLQLSSPPRSATPIDQSKSSTDMTNTTTAAAVPGTQPEASSTPTKSGTATPATGARTPSSTTPRKSHKPRCSKAGCKAAAQPIVGDCGFCQKRFCGKHRMLESHNCEGLEDARQADKQRNAAKLEGERTVMLRGL